MGPQSVAGGFPSAGEGLPDLGTPTLSWDELPHHSFSYPAAFLNLRWTLACGQAFRWRDAGDGWWVGVVRSAALRVRMDGDTVTYAAYPDLPAPNFWRAYLRLDFDLEDLYRDAGAADAHAAAAFRAWPGLRVLRQEPEETIYTYLCTTANSIPRIARAVEGMSRVWGERIATLDGVAYHAFPPASVLTPDAVPLLVRECNLGYRAAVLVRARAAVAEHGAGWVRGLRRRSYKEAHAALMALPGVGPKVADCVCLFALDMDEAVPVDTHMRQVARELYLPETGAKALTAGGYARVAGHFRDLFGARAGWATQYLFYSHLMRHRDAPVL